VILLCQDVAAIAMAAVVFVVTRNRKDINPKFKAPSTK
jgi:hypothetical protein